MFLSNPPIMSTEKQPDLQILVIFTNTRVSTEYSNNTNLLYYIYLKFVSRTYIVHELFNIKNNDNGNPTTTRYEPFIIFNHLLCSLFQSYVSGLKLAQVSITRILGI